MHVIWHDYPSAEFVEPSFPFASNDGLHDQAGDPWIFQPRRSGAVAIQGAIRGDEGMAGRGISAE